MRLVEVIENFDELRTVVVRIVDGFIGFLEGLSCQGLCETVFGCFVTTVDY